MKSACLLGLTMVLLACTSSEEAGESAPLAATTRFEEVENRLLAADSLRCSYRVVSRGAFEADLTGTLNIAGDQVQVDSAGEFGGRPVDVLLRADRDSCTFGHRDQPLSIATPPELKKALLVGFTRMGILHNLARLIAGQPPDHGDGGVATWAVVDSVRDDPVEPEAVSFDIEVAGNPSGSASLEFDAQERPILRRQVVRFSSGEMRVEERYLEFRIGS